MPEAIAVGLLDTSVVIELDSLPADVLPREGSVSAVTFAELVAGPFATDDLIERARRQDRLQRVEAVFDPVPFGLDAARAYGQVYAAVLSRGRNPRRRFADLLIAATAVAEGIPLVTRNADDLRGLEALVEIVPV